MKTLLENWRKNMREEKQKDSKRIAKAVLIKKDQVLLIKRSNYMDRHAGEWDLPGGHVMEGEDLVDGLLREVWEETGLHIKRPAKVHSAGNDTYYVADLPEGEVKLSNEHTEHGMFKISELGEIDFPAKYTKAVKEALG
jgi:8-oxo-dGTP diphosphatase